jgi:ankyrin repeat protein
MNSKIITTAIILVLAGLGFIALFAVRKTLKADEFKKAIQTGDARRAEELLRSEPALVTVDLGERSGDKLQPLSLAASLGKEDICLLPLQHKADVNSVDKYKFTPLHRAVRAGHTNIVVLLLKSSANLRAEDNTGKTPMSYAKGEMMCALLSNAVVAVTVK